MTARAHRSWLLAAGGALALCAPTRAPAFERQWALELGLTAGSVGFQSTPTDRMHGGAGVTLAGGRMLTDWFELLATVGAAPLHPAALRIGSGSGEWMRWATGGGRLMFHGFSGWKDLGPSAGGWCGQLTLQLGIGVTPIADFGAPPALFRGLATSVQLGLEKELSRAASVGLAVEATNISPSSHRVIGDSEWQARSYTGRVLGIAIYVRRLWGY